MKAVADTMIWVSYPLKPGGFRHWLILAARRQRVRLFGSDYILDELERTLVEDFNRTRRFAMLAPSLKNLRAAGLWLLFEKNCLHPLSEPLEYALEQGQVANTRADG